MSLLTSLRQPRRNVDIGALTDGTQPTGALADTFDRHIVTAALTPTSGTVYMTAISLAAGTLVSNISLRSAVGITSPTHWQFGLYSSARSQLAVSADQLTAAWGTNVTATLAMSTPYSVQSTGLHYIAMFYTGSALTLRASGVTDQMAAVAPILAGSSDTGVSILPASAAALTATVGGFYAWVT